MGLTVKCGLSAVAVAFLSLWPAAAHPASAQDVCSQFDQIVEAVEKGNFNSLKHFALPQAECESRQASFACSWVHRYIDSTTARNLRRGASRCGRRDKKAFDALEKSIGRSDYYTRKWVKAEAEKDQVCGSYEQLRDSIYQPALADAEKLAASIKQCFHAGRIRGSWEPFERKGSRTSTSWASESDAVILHLEVGVKEEDDDDNDEEYPVMSGAELVFHLDFLRR